MSSGALVVVDTNVLISAALRPQSVPWQVFAYTLAAGRLVVCDQTLAELEDVLQRSKFDRLATRERRASILALIRERGVPVAVQPQHSLASRGVCRDPDDELFLALALAAGAETIVSGDEDLLILTPWRGVAMCTPAQYLARRV